MSLALACSVMGAGSVAHAKPRQTRSSPQATRVAQAPPARTPDQTGASVDKQRARIAASQAQRARLLVDKAALIKSYQGQLAEIDRLKQQRASWRRDRQIRSHMSESHGTAAKLSALDERIRSLDAIIRKRQEQLMQAIERELAGSPNDTRRKQLTAWRRGARKDGRRGAKKIVLPEDTIDPLADPEELEYQASLLRQSERELARELERLDKQAKRYRHMSALRRKYQRADEFGRFDDDRPRRTSGSSTRVQGSTDAVPEAADDAGAPPQSPGEQSPSGDDFDAGATDDPMFDVVLADVVDATTIQALRAAGNSSDPKIKARAAERAREQVKKRMERLHKRREQMQQRAKSLQDQP